MPYPVLDRDFPPTHSVRFTSFASQIVLAGTSSGTSAPHPIQHLPCQVAVEVAEVDEVLSYTDSAGVVNELTFPAVGFYVIRMAPATIEASPATTISTGVTVFWNSAP